MFARWAATRNRRHVHAASARCGTVCGSHARLQPQGCQPIVQETLRKKKEEARSTRGPLSPPPPPPSSHRCLAQKEGGGGGKTKQLSFPLATPESLPLPASTRARPEGRRLRRTTTTPATYAAPHHFCKHMMLGKIMEYSWLKSSEDGGPRWIPNRP